MMKNLVLPMWIATVVFGVTMEAFVAPYGSTRRTSTPPVILHWSAGAPVEPLEMIIDQHGRFHVPGAAEGPSMTMTDDEEDDEEDEQSTLAIDIERLQQEHEKQIASLQERVNYFQKALQDFQEESNARDKKVAEAAAAAAAAVAASKATETTTSATTTISTDESKKLEERLKKSEEALLMEQTRSAQLSVELTELQEKFTAQVTELAQQYEDEIAKRQFLEQEHARRLLKAQADAETKLQQSLERNIQNVQRAKHDAKDELVRKEVALMQAREELMTARTAIQDATAYISELNSQRNSLSYLVRQYARVVKDRFQNRVRNTKGRVFLAKGRLLDTVQIAKDRVRQQLRPNEIE